MIFTSATGVRYFRELAAAGGADLRALTGTRIAAVGRATASAVKTLGLGVSFQPSRADASSLARELPHIKNRRILLLQADIANAAPAKIMRERLAEVTALPVYRTTAITTPDPAYEPLLTFGQVRAHVLASPSAVDGLSHRLSEAGLARARSLPAIAVGPTTASALGAAGFTAVRTATIPSVSALLELLT